MSQLFELKRTRNNVNIYIKYNNKNGCLKNIYIIVHKQLVLNLVNSKVLYLG